MRHLNIIEEVIKQAEKITKDKDKDNEKNYKENLINLTVYTLSQMPYFNNRYDFMRLFHKEQSNVTLIRSQEANFLPLMTNKMGTIESDFGFMNVNLVNHKEIVLKDKDIKALKGYVEIIESTDNFFDFIKKIKIKDKEDDDFIVTIKRLMPSRYDKSLFDMVLHFLDEKEHEEINKKLKIYSRNNSLDMFLLRDNFSFELSNNIKKSPKEIIKGLTKNEKSHMVLESLTNNAVNFRSNKFETDIKLIIKNFNKLIKKGHPLLKKSPFNILMTIKDPEERVKTLIDLNLYKPLKKEELLNINEHLNNSINEQHILRNYKQDIDEIINEIIKQYPELKNNVTEMKNFQILERVIDENSDEPLMNFPQNWLINEHWNDNESLKGISYMQEDFINNNYGKDKIIIAIKNNIENVGYITLYKENNILRLHSITPIPDLINSSSFIETCNKTLKDYIEKNNIKMVLTDNPVIPMDIENILTEESNELYVKDIGAYIAGDITRKFKNKNIFNQEMEDIFSTRSVDLKQMNISNKMIDKFKSLEQNYDHINKDDIDFKEELKLKNEIRKKVINIVENKEEKKAIKHV